MSELPPIPDDDKDFTPALARKIIEQYQVLVERQRAALEKVLIGVNHIATYRGDDWPPVGTDHERSLEILGASIQYDMWCCWNAAMQARDSITSRLRSDHRG